MMLISHSPYETRLIASRLVKKLHLPSSIGLIGPLGSGKTVFVQGVAKALGAKEPIKSPTFVYLVPYELPKGRRLIHVDAYRLDHPDQAQTLGLKDVFHDPQAIVIIEWADKIKPFLPPKTWLVNFKIVDEKSRAISFD